MKSSIPPLAPNACFRAAGACRLTTCGLLLALFTLLVVPVHAATDGGNLVPNPQLRLGPDGAPLDWRAWTPREMLKPAMSVVTRDGQPMLSLQAKRFASYGLWVTVVPNIKPGSYYRFQVISQATHMVSKELSVMALLRWGDAKDGGRILQTDYIDEQRPEGAWCLNYRTALAPAGAKSVSIELGLRSTKDGAVLWRDMQLTEVPPPPVRMVRIVTTQIVPKYPSTIATNTSLMADMLDVVGPLKPNFVLFSECLDDRFVPLPIAQKVQPIPGPLTEMLSAKARKYHTYIITSLHEEAKNGLFYNTAVLIDPEGNIAGKYRKVHLTLAEIDWGLTPGSTYPVFHTKFGPIGMMICYDNWFEETARILRLQGARMIFFPLAGDGRPIHWLANSRGCAMNNGVYLISSSTVSNNMSQIIDPAGEVLATTTGRFSFAVQDIDLNQQWWVRYYSVDSGMGEPGSLVIKERRPDTYRELVNGDPGSHPAEAAQAAASRH